MRIGNGAWDQSQLDTYGWLLASSWFAETHSVDGADSEQTHQTQFVHDVVEHAIARFDETDEGIWEVRGGRQHFLFSKLMMWLAVDIGLRLEAHRPGHALDLARWREARDQMRRRIEDEGVDHERGVFVQAFGSKALDASALQIASIGFLPASDPRFVATVEAIDEELGRGGHIYRYLLRGWPRR